jgi:kanamycin kinase
MGGSDGMEVTLHAGPPASSVPVPAAVTAVAAGGAIRAVWRNELGGVTFEVGTGPARRFVKWTPASSGVDLAREATRLRWASAFTPVASVLDEGIDADGSWMVLSALAGESAVSVRWKRDPARAVTAIGTGLRALHDALPVAACPFSWSVEDRLADANRRADAGLVERSRWHPVHRSLTVDQALGLLREAPAIDRLVVCHGDACVPNILVADDGSWSAHVDLGSLGVADRWADIAVATWSTEWNFGPGWEGHLLDAYGIDADVERTRYYRLLWDLGP